VFLLFGLFAFVATVLPAMSERWEKDDYTPIIDIARNEGTVISLN